MRSSISGSSRSTIVWLTLDSPGVSLPRFSGAVASSAISTYRSRSRPTSSSSSSPPGCASTRGDAEHGLRLVDHAVGARLLGVLAYPSAVEEPGRAVIALLRVDLHRRAEPRRPAEQPERADRPTGSLRSCPSSTWCTSASSSSTAPSAPASSLGPRRSTTSAAPSSRAATRSSCLTRPDVIADMHDVVLRGRRRRRRDGQLRGVRAPSSPSTTSPDRAHELNVAAARIAVEVARRLRRRRPPALRRRLDRSGHQAAVARSHPLRRAARRLRGAGARPARGRRRPVPRSRPAYDLLQAKAAMIGCRRAMAAEGRDGAAAGAGHDGDDRAHAGRHRDRRRARLARRHASPTCFGLNCATGPARDDRAPAPPLPALRRCRSRCCPTPACRAWSTATPTTTSRPSELAELPPPLRRRARRAASSAAAAARRPSTCAAVVEAVPRPRRRPPPARTYEPSVSSIYSPVSRSRRTRRS